MEVEFRVGDRVAELDLAKHTKEQIVKLLEGLVQKCIAAHCPRTTQTRNAVSQSNRGVWAPITKGMVTEGVNIGKGTFVRFLTENFNLGGSGSPSGDEQDYRKPIWQGGLGERGLDGLFPLVKPPLREDSVKFESLLAAVNSLRHIGAEPWDLEILDDPTYYPRRVGPPASFRESDIRNVGWLGDSFAAIPRPPYQRNSAQPWEGGCRAPQAAGGCGGRAACLAKGSRRYGRGDSRREGDGNDLESGRRAGPANGS